MLYKSSWTLQSPRKTLTVLRDDQRRSNHHDSYENENLGNRNSNTEYVENFLKNLN